MSFVQKMFKGMKEKRRGGSGAAQSPAPTQSPSQRSPGSPGGFDASFLPSPELSPSGTGIEVMESALQDELRRGVRYNMKIVVRGDRGCGKSMLLQRLQGKPFDAAYEKTPQLHAATIHWRSRASHAQQAADGEYNTETVKVEVWDVVDLGFATPAMQARHEALYKKLGTGGGGGGG
eukprot:Rhum_TRINITY_DN14121_c46_g1::Rhum_TRINITY_DN14121_c46_g1_i1::g.71526::m.71526